MGGRGAMMDKGFVTREFRSVGTIAGIKVLEYADKGKKKPKLPGASTTPGTSYMLRYEDGTGRQIKVYGGDRLPVLDYDRHPHKGKMDLHKHIYIDGEKVKGHLPLTGEEMKKYGKLLTGKRKIKRRKP